MSCPLNRDVLFGIIMNSIGVVQCIIHHVLSSPVSKSVQIRELAIAHPSTFRLQGVIHFSQGFGGIGWNHRPGQTEFQPVSLATDPTEVLGRR
jgi:hypothetical protein